MSNIEQDVQAAIEEWKNCMPEPDCWSDCTNEAFDFDRFEYRRKTSAALPFDIERAKEDGAVEMCDAYGHWFICTSKTFESRKHPLIQLDNCSVSEFNLRMKYPPKAQS